MESVLRRLRLIKGDGRDSEARKRLQKELFAFTACSDHGCPSEPTALAYDPKLKLLAVATNTGAIGVYGKPGVYFCAQHKNSYAMKICFLPDQGRIITFSADNSLYLWELNEKDNGVTVLEQVKSFEMENSKLKMISSYCLNANADQLMLGTDGGNVHIFDISTFSLLDKTLLQDVIVQNAPADFKVGPGAVETILRHPVESDKFLIGYNRGLIVLWDMASDKPEQMYNTTQQLESVVFNGDGSEFVTCHTDGCYTLWNTNDASNPKENPNTPYGPFPCKAITSIDWKEGKIDPWMIFSGGMPRANFGDRHTVSVIHGKTHVAFDFSSRVVDFLTLSDDDGSVDPHSLVVLTAKELVAVDLTSDGWPVYRSPYLVSIDGCSAVTSMLHIGNVTDSLWSNIVLAGKSQFQSCSDKEWPIVGGQLSDLSEKLPNDILLTGHSDGSVCFWDVRVNGGLCLLYTLSSAEVFATDSAGSDPAATAPQEDEWPPFRKIGSVAPSVTDERLAVRKLAFCPSSEALVLGGSIGQLLVYKFEAAAGERKLEAVTMDLIAGREDCAVTSTDKLNVRGDIAWTLAGFQPSSVVLVYPPSKCTTLTVDAENQLVAASTSYGFGVFDLVRMKTVYVSSVSVPCGVRMSRSRSFQKTLRDSFRQLRRSKTETGQGIDQKAEPKVSETKIETEEKTDTKAETGEKTDTQPETVDKPETVAEVVIETVEKSEEKEEKLDSPKIEELEEKMQAKEEEKAIVVEVEEKMETKTSGEPEITGVVEEVKPEAGDSKEPTHAEKAAETETPVSTPSKTKRTREEMLVMTDVESLHFAKTNLFQSQQLCYTLWVGTKSGHVFIYHLSVPDAEKRQEDDIKCVLAKEIRLKHGAPVVNIFVVDHNLRPLSAVLQPHDAAAEGDSSAAIGGHKVVVCSQQQVKIFSLPNLKPHDKYKLSVHGDDGQFTDSTFAHFVSKSDEALKEFDLVCLTSLNKLLVLSVPHLRRQLETDAVIQKTDTSDDAAITALTHTGGLFYSMTSELRNFSVSALPTAPRCSVQLKDGMRPAPAVVEVTEAAEAPKEVEAAVAETAETAEPVVAEEVKPIVEEAAVSGGEKVTDVSVTSANDSVAAGDVTADSIQVHLKEESVVSESSAAVASHKVTETVVHSIKTVGGSVSESTTTTVEELKHVEGMMSECVVSSSTVSTTTSSVKVEGN